MCLETKSNSESETKSETNDEATSAKAKEEFVHTLHGTRLPRRIPVYTVYELRRRVYNKHDDNSLIIVHEGKGKAMRVIMAQLSLKQS